MNWFNWCWPWKRRHYEKMIEGIEAQAEAEIEYLRAALRHQKELLAKSVAECDGLRIDLHTTMKAESSRRRISN